MDITPVLTGGGIIVLLAGIIGYLLTANWKDRAQQQSVLSDLRNRLNKQSEENEERFRVQSQYYDGRLREMETRYTTRIEQMESRIESLEKEVEAERKLRIAAEIKAARLEYELGLPRGRQRGAGTP